MHNREIALCAIILGLTTHTMSARDTFAPDTMGIFADAAATGRSLEAASFQVQYYYVVAVNNEPLWGWWGLVEFSQPGWTVLGWELFPHNALQGGEYENFIVGLGACLRELPTQPLVRGNFGYFQWPIPSDLQICLRPAIGAGAGAANPGYQNCSNELIVAQLSPAIGMLPAGCLVVNPRTTISTSSRSWGAIKASF